MLCDKDPNGLTVCDWQVIWTRSGKVSSNFCFCDLSNRHEAKWASLVSEPLERLWFYESWTCLLKLMLQCHSCHWQRFTLANKRSLNNRHYASIMTAKEGKMCLCPEYRWLELRLPQDKQVKKKLRGNVWSKHIQCKSKVNLYLTFRLSVVM